MIVNTPDIVDSAYEPVHECVISSKSVHAGPHLSVQMWLCRPAPPPGTALIDSSIPGCHGDDDGCVLGCQGDCCLGVLSACII